MKFKQKIIQPLVRRFGTALFGVLITYDLTPDQALSVETAVVALLSVALDLWFSNRSKA